MRPHERCRRPKPHRPRHYRPHLRQSVSHLHGPDQFLVATSRYKTVQDPASKAARLVANGKVVGWFQGRSEVGPRALGARSILADPRRPEMRDIVNHQVKRREWFRPFAPSVLHEHGAEYFEGYRPNPFMLVVQPVRSDRRDQAPASPTSTGPPGSRPSRRAQTPISTGSSPSSTA